MEIKFNNVSYSYIHDIKALDNLNVKISKNKITGIIGPTGSGKTTLAELIDGLLVPTEGTIQVGEYDSSKKNRDMNKHRMNVGLVFQFPEEQFFKKTVEEEILFGLKNFKPKSFEYEKKLKEILELVNLSPEYLKINPFALSNGEKRKVALASILIFNPTVIILDEPTVGLDSVSKKHMITMLRKLRTKFDKTVIIISHDIELIHSISDDVIVMNNGSIVMQGSKYEVFKETDILLEHGIRVPKIMEFSNKVRNEKNIKLGYIDNVNDLIKEIYRHVK